MAILIKIKKMKKLYFFLIALCLPTFALAVEVGKSKTVTMSTVDAVKMAGDFVYTGDYDKAQDILTQMPQTNSLPVEIERWYLLAQIEQKKGNIDEAIKIYRKILDDQPDLTKIRYELAVCYMMKHQWYRADYHLRLAMAGKDIPDEIKQRMMYLRYVARQNKNWNVWFNFGAAPDTNANQATGGKECIVNEWGEFCRYLPEPERVIGTNLSLGGNYEFKLTDKHWRWKSDAMIYTNVYNRHKYDDLYLSASTGPRYIWDRGDVWLAGIVNRRWYGWDRYNWAYGAKLDTNYDFTQRLSGGLLLKMTENSYDIYSSYMNSEIYTVAPRLVYTFGANKRIILNLGLDRENTVDNIYANWRKSIGVGFDIDAYYGFHFYVEPWFSWARYDEERMFVKNDLFVFEPERDFIQRYSFMISNNNINVWGFIPALTLGYTKNKSNIPQRNYDKITVGLTVYQSF